MTKDKKNKSAKASQAKKPTRLEQLETLLTRPKGASIEEMCRSAGSQSHSIRGAMAGALKRKGLRITSEKKNSERRYFGSRDQ